MLSIFLPLLLLGSGLQQAGGPPPNTDELEPLVKQLVNVYATVEQEAADPVEPDKAFYQGAIPSMLRRLDPHSVFFDPGQFEQLKQMQRSTQKGFGSIVSVLPGRIIVLQAMPGTPSAKSGMAAGDEILAINGYRVDRLDMDQLVELLSESRQQRALLDIRKPGNARIMQLVLVPEDVQTPSVERIFFLRAGVGYLRVSSFDNDTGKQIKEAIEKLGGANLKALVLDLRNNPGGLLPAALQTAALFLKPGQVVLTTGGRSVGNKKEEVPKFATPYTFPLVVLVNERTASAAEIVAGALQDHDRAIIAGAPTFGKGLVESVFPIFDSTGLALTTAFYYTPSGRSIQKAIRTGSQLDPAAAAPAKTFRTDAGREVQGGGGIQPDYTVGPEPTTQLRAVLEASGSFPSFATAYLEKHGKIMDDFEVTPQTLDEYKLYLAERNIQPTVSQWSSERDWIHSRLKTEIFNQGLGVEKGDEVEAQRDPVILKALEVLKAR
jgi:carboxyl-terminal processing protease